MPNKNSIVGKIENGHIQINPMMLARFCERNKGRWVDITAREPKRTLSQNAMYWAWLHAMCEQTGNESAENMHEFLLQTLSPIVIRTIRGKTGAHEVKGHLRSSEMTKLQMSEYMEKCAVYTNFPLPTKEELARMGYISNT